MTERSKECEAESVFFSLCVVCVGKCVCWAAIIRCDRLVSVLLCVFLWVTSAVEFEFCTEMQVFDCNPAYSVTLFPLFAMYTQFPCSIS